MAIHEGSPQNPDVSQTDSGSTFELWRGPQGQMRLDWNRTGALRIICVGHGHAEFVVPILRRMDELLRAGAPGFMQVCDWFDMETYDSAFRVQHGNWISQHKAQWNGAHVLLRSKLVSMGIAVANLGLGGKINTYTSRPEFDVMCRKLGFALNPPMPK